MALSANNIECISPVAGLQDMQSRIFEYLNNKTPHEIVVVYHEHRLRSCLCCGSCCSQVLTALFMVVLLHYLDDLILAQ